jgi:HAMP domain-containing protein
MADDGGRGGIRPPRRSGAETVARRFVVAFSAMFVIPMLLSAYLLTVGRADAANPVQLGALALFCGLLGTAGFFICRSVVHSLLVAVREADAIAGGEIDRRMDTGASGEIGELAGHFNRITGRLQRTVNSLEASKAQTQALLAQICGTTGRPVEMQSMLDMFLKTLLSLTGLEAGAIFLPSPDGSEYRLRAGIGLDGRLRDAVIPAGSGAVGRVAARGQTLTTSEPAAPAMAECATAPEECLSWALHVPMTASGKNRGVMTIGMRTGRGQVAADDLQMIGTLSAQVAVAIENSELKDRMERSYVETVSALAAAVEARDKYTRGHSRRVTEYSVGIARVMGLPEALVRDLESAALLHDIGKIGIPDHVLHSPGAPPPAESSFIHGHPIGGENILKPVGSLSRLCPVVRHHHERFDGTGYPDRLRGEAIPLAARILAVADAYDAMTSGRPYQPTRTREEALAELGRCRGTQFDPSCVEALCALLGAGHLQYGVRISR